MLMIDINMFRSAGSDIRKSISFSALDSRVMTLCFEFDLLMILWKELFGYFSVLTSANQRMEVFP